MFKKFEKPSLTALLRKTVYKLDDSGKTRLTSATLYYL